MPRIEVKRRNCPQGARDISSEKNLMKSSKIPDQSDQSQKKIISTFLMMMAKTCMMRTSMKKNQIQNCVKVRHLISIEIRPREDIKSFVNLKIQKSLFRENK